MLASLRPARLLCTWSGKGAVIARSMVHHEAPTASGDDKAVERKRMQAALRALSEEQMAAESELLGVGCCKGALQPLLVNDAPADRQKARQALTPPRFQLSAARRGHCEARAGAECLPACASHGHLCALRSTA